MNIKELRKLISDIPDETEVSIFNSSYEWYGEEEMLGVGWKLINNKFVYIFSGCWDEYDVKDYEESHKEE
jgi:hypothetical protein